MHSRTRVRRNTSMRCYIELGCEHGECRNTVLIGETNRSLTQGYKIRQHPSKTVVADGVGDTIDHMILSPIVTKVTPRLLNVLTLCTYTPLKRHIGAI